MEAQSCTEQSRTSLCCLVAPVLKRRTRGVMGHVSLVPAPLLPEVTHTVTHLDPCREPSPPQTPTVDVWVSPCHQTRTARAVSLWQPLSPLRAAGETGPLTHQLAGRPRAVGVAAEWCPVQGQRGRFLNGGQQGGVRPGPGCLSHVGGTAGGDPGLPLLRVTCSWKGMLPPCPGRDSHVFAPVQPGGHHPPRPRPSGPPLALPAAQQETWAWRRGSGAGHALAVPAGQCVQSRGLSPRAATQSGH